MINELIRNERFLNVTITPPHAVVNSCVIIWMNHIVDVSCTRV